MKTIEINGKEYKVKYTIRALFLFESITEKPFSIVTLQDSYLFTYCILLANNADNALEWNDFIDALDDDPTLFTKLNNLVNQSSKIDEMLMQEDKESGVKKN